MNTPFLSFPLLVNKCMCMSCNASAFTDEVELEQKATDPRYGQMIFAGIVFVNPFPDPKSLPKNIKYKIRPKAEPYDRSSANADHTKRFSWFTNIMYPSRSRPREPKKTPFGGYPPGKACASKRFPLKHHLVCRCCHL